MNSLVLHWKFDPVLLTLGPLSIRWYGLLFVGAFFSGQFILARMFEAEAIPSRHAERLLLYALVGTVIGARLSHCLFYDPEFYFSHPLAILRVWEGGLASHGGALGLLFGLWIGTRTSTPRIPYVWLVDRVAVPAALGATLVRTANFLNSEIIGTPTSGNWGVVFEAVDQLPRHPVQLYEAAAYLAIFFVLLHLYRTSRDRSRPGLISGCFLLLVFSARLGAEFFKVPQAAYEAGQLLTVGQYLSLPFVIVGGNLIFRAKRGA